MLFKDRADAAGQLHRKLAKDPLVKKSKNNLAIVSLLRGGIVIGDILARRLNCPHLPLAVAKIPAPNNPELAIGALCFDIVYLEESVIKSLSIVKKDIPPQIQLARLKFEGYLERFNLNRKSYNTAQDKTAILVDDGVATGATIKAAILYLRSLRAKKIILAVPVAPSDFEIRGVDKVIILHKDPMFSAVSQFYKNFPQLEDEQVKKIIQ